MSFVSVQMKILYDHLTPCYSLNKGSAYYFQAQNYATSSRNYICLEKEYGPFTLQLDVNDLQILSLCHSYRSSNAKAKLLSRETGY